MKVLGIDNFDALPLKTKVMINDVEYIKIGYREVAFIRHQDYIDSHYKENKVSLSPDIQFEIIHSTTIKKQTP